jgi:hypothetical protein
VKAHEKLLLSRLGMRSIKVAFYISTSSCKIHGHGQDLHGPHLKHSLLIRQQILPDLRNLLITQTHHLPHIPLRTPINPIDHLNRIPHLLRLRRNHIPHSLLISLQRRILEQTLSKQRF